MGRWLGRQEGGSQATADSSFLYQEAELLEGDMTGNVAAPNPSKHAHVGT